MTYAVRLRAHPRRGTDRRTGAGRLSAREAGRLSKPELTVRQFPGGHSNLTYLLEAGGREYVLRRPPLGPVAPKAHDMAREYNVLGAVHPFFRRRRACSCCAMTRR